LLSTGVAKPGIRLQVERRAIALRPRGWRVSRRGPAPCLCLFASLQMALQLLCSKTLMGQQVLPPVSTGRLVRAQQGPYRHQLVLVDARRGLLQQLTQRYPEVVVQQRDYRRLQISNRQSTRLNYSYVL